jgi:hypothetical protein
MRDCADARWPVDGPPVLSRIVQGVQFSMDVLDERLMVVVMAELLMSRFGASKDPAVWIATVERHRLEIEALAGLHRRAGARTIVLTDGLG